MVMGSSQIWPPWVMDDIHAKAELGRYRVRGFSTFQKVTHFDDLTFLSTGLTRFPLEGYKERCNTRTELGARHAENPLVIETPTYISGMSYGALSANAKVALGKAASMAGTASCTGDGGMLQAERDASDKLIYQVLPSRYGFDPNHLVQAQALEDGAGAPHVPLAGLVAAELVGRRLGVAITTVHVDGTSQGPSVRQGLGFLRAYDEVQCGLGVYAVDASHHPSGQADLGFDVRQ